MKKYLIVPFLLTVGLNAKAFNENQSVSLGPLSISMKYCEQVDKISAITNSFSNVRWPVTGVPGVTMGLIQNSNVILGFCNYLGQLKNLDQMDQALKTAEYLNKLTGNKFDDELNLTRSTYDLRTVVIDSSGKKRPMSAVLTASNASRLNNYYKEVGNYYDNHLNSGDPVNVRSREQLESDMNRLNKLTYNKAQIDDVAKCPTPNTDNDKIKDAYDNDIVPIKDAMEKNQSYIDFYSESLRRMGIKFASNEKAHKEYVKDLNNLIIQSHKFEINVQSKKVNTVTREAVDYDKTDPMADRTKEVKSKIDQKYQSFAVTPNKEILETFVKKYAKSWNEWTTGNIQTKGLLTDTPKASVEDEFIEWSLYCNTGEIRSKLDENDPRFQYKYEQAVKDCKSKQNKKISEAGGLLKFMAEDLFAKNQKYKEGQASVWTFESYWFGYFRTVNGQSDENGYAQEKVACSQLSNMAVMQDLLVKQQGVNTELNQMLVEQAMKQNAMDEAKAKDELSKKQEEDRRNAIAQEEKRRREAEYSKYMNYNNNMPEPAKKGF